MHRAEAATLVAALIGTLAGCSHPSVTASAKFDAAIERAPVQTNLRAEARLAPAASEAPLIRIDSFDCEKYPPLPGQPEPQGLVKAEVGIRSWHGGGPDGASWNVDDLRCTARVITKCRAGKVAITARIGRSVVTEQELPLSGTEALEPAFIIPSKTWRRQLDEAPKHARRQPFKTASFRLLAESTCMSPMEATPGEWRFTDLSAEDSFVAGFADGE
ncbi:MAG: hypothetical protein QOI66_29 [Myxococcales bacterium]|jgi:hypothetical protein|nr:hypothetical protein [Myxococcales bacterium]